MHAITANRLTDGEVVWLAAHDQWIETVGAAALFETKVDVEAALKRAADWVDRRVIVDPYAIAISTESGRPEPVRFREKIRALGPTVRPDLGKQARSARSAAA